MEVYGTHSMALHTGHQGPPLPYIAVDCRSLCRKYLDIVKEKKVMTKAVGKMHVKESRNGGGAIPLKHKVGRSRNGNESNTTNLSTTKTKASWKRWAAKIFDWKNWTRKFNFYFFNKPKPLPNCKQEKGVLKRHNTILWWKTTIDASFKSTKGTKTEKISADSKRPL